MLRSPRFDPANQVTRWTAYFDLLGTRALIRSGKILEVFTAYRKALDQLRRHKNVSCSWFSDSFLLYAPDDSGEAFTEIDLACRWFVFNLIHARIPVRGAIAHGALYADDDGGAYFGEALVDAYNWCEDQDWLGFVVTPHAVRRLSEIKVDIAELLNYRLYPVPLKKGPRANYAACLLGNWNRQVVGDVRRNQLLPVLESMQSAQMSERAHRKYENTLTFLRAHEQLR